MTRTPIDGALRVNVYEVMTRAVEEGIAYGWRRAHKHTDTPSEETIRDEIERGVMNALMEVFEVGEP